MRTIIHNCTFIPDGSSRIESGYLIIENGSIQEIGSGAMPSTETGKIAGSAFGINDAVLFVKNTCHASMNDIVQNACVNPSVLAQADHKKGSLEVGKDADIVIVDEKINIKHVLVSGKEVYTGCSCFE